MTWWARGINPDYDDSSVAVNCFANMLTIAELAVETLPQMIIVVINNSLIDAKTPGEGWSTVSVVSFCFSAFFFHHAVDGCSVENHIRGGPRI